MSLLFPRVPYRTELNVPLGEDVTKKIGICIGTSWVVQSITLKLHMEKPSQTQDLLAVRHYCAAHLKCVLKGIF